MKTLGDGRARELMDWLEWDQDNNAAQPHNGRFGTRGLELLSQLDPDSPKWEQAAKDFGAIPREERQRFIDAAIIASNPSNKTLLDQVDGGDEIFEWNDIPDWLTKQPDGIIGDFKQGKEGDCWLLSSIKAVSQDEDGKKILANMITLNKDGTYTVNFKNTRLVDWGGPVVISRDDIDADLSSGDMDVAIIEAAARKARGTINGAGDGIGLDALTGQGSMTYFYKGSPLTREKLQEILDKDKDGLTMTFCGQGDTDDHILYVDSIDLKNNTVNYRNPWDTTKHYTMSVDEFLRMPSISYLEVNAPTA